MNGSSRFIVYKTVLKSSLQNLPQSGDQEIMKSTLLILIICFVSLSDSTQLCKNYRDNGKVFINPYDCTVYLQCHASVAITRHCPKGTVFSRRIHACVNKHSFLDDCKVQPYPPYPTQIPPYPTQNQPYPTQNQPYPPKDQSYSKNQRYPHSQRYPYNQPHSPKTQGHRSQAPRDSCAPYDQRYYHKQLQYIPQDLRPMHYEIQLVPILNKFKSHYGGRVKIRFRVEKKTSRIHLNSADLSVEGTAKLSSVNCTVPLVTGVDNFAGRNQLVIGLDRDLTEGCEYDTELAFNGKLADKLSGFTGNTLQNDYRNGPVLSPVMNGGQVRGLFPSFNDLGIATYKLMIGDIDGMMIATNTPMLIDRNRVCEFATTPPLKLDQIGFVQGKFHSMEKETAKVKVRVLSKKKDATGLHYVLEETTVYVDVLSDYFGHPLPIKKIDYLAVPGPTAKELSLPGLIMRKERDISVDKANAEMKVKQNAALIIAKAVAEQWTNGVLHPASDPQSAWIQEGLAHHLSYVAVHLKHPEMQMERGLEYSEIEKAIHLEATSLYHSLNLQSRDPDNYHRVSRDELTTFKSAALMRMIEGVVGITKFRGAIQKFMTEYKHKTFEMEDFKHVMMKISGMEEIGSMIDAYGTYRGVPIVSVVMETGNIVRVSQRNYNENFESLLRETNSSYHHDYFTGQLPVDVITSESGEPKDRDFTWVGPKTYVDIPLPGLTPDDGWILANKDRLGYYVVDYDVTNWKRLARQLQLNHTVFTPATRSQLIFDSTHLFSLGLLDSTVALEMLTYMKKEKELGVWESALRSLDYWRIVLKGTPADKQLEKFVQHLIGDIYKTYRLGQKHADQSFRQRQAVIAFAACDWNLYACLEDAVTLFSELLQISSFSVPTTADIRETVYCVGIQHSLVGAWQYVRRAFFTTADPTERLLLLRAMGCSPKEETIVSYLHMSLDRRFDRSYVPHIISATARNPCSNRLAWFYVEHKFEDLRCLFRDKPYVFEDIIVDATARYSKSFEYYEIKNFYHRGEHTKQAKHVFQAVLGVIRRRSDVILQHYNTIFSWLQDCLTEFFLDSPFGTFKPVSAPLLNV